MTDRASRHFGLATYQWPAPGQAPGASAGLTLYQPRLAAAPPGVLFHRVESNDRLDLLAYRYLGDPHRYWRIADANGEVDLADLLEPGRVLAIPERGD